MSKQTTIVGHFVALVLLGLWGILELGLAGTLTLAFWFVWLLYAAFLVWMNSGSTVAAWLVLGPPVLWAAVIGSRFVPNALAAFAAGSVNTQALVGAVLVAFPCGAAVAIHLGYAASICKRWRPICSTAAAGTVGKLR